MLPSAKLTSTRYSKAEPLHKYLTLDFKEDRATFGRFRSHRIREQHTDKNSTFFSTFYSKETPNSYRRHLVKSSNLRQTPTTNRDSVIGTPFTTVEFNDPESNATVLPTLDLQRYRYLLKAISGISKTKKMPEFPLPKTQPKLPQSPSPINQQPQSKEIASPKILNLSIGFEQHANHFFKAECENAFQKMFKNKQLLIRGRHSSPRAVQNDKYSFNFLGEEELRVSQIPQQARKQKRPLIK